MMTAGYSELWLLWMVAAWAGTSVSSSRGRRSPSARRSWPRVPHLGINVDDVADVAAVDFFVVVILDLHDLVARRKRTSQNARPCVRRRAEVGHRALIDAIGVDDDPARGGLPEHLRQSHHSTAPDPMMSARTCRVRRRAAGRYLQRSAALHGPELLSQAPAST
jgi:hypothetical protein